MFLALVGDVRDKPQVPEVFLGQPFAWHTKECRRQSPLIDLSGGLGWCDRATFL